MLRRLILFSLAVFSFTYAENIKTIKIPNVPDKPLKDDTDKKLVETYCRICHSLNYISMQKNLSKRIWELEVNKMLKFGAPVENQKDIDAIIDYLSKNY